MDVLGRQALEEFKASHAGVRGQLDAWLAEAEEADWNSPLELKRRYPTASILSENRVVFNVKGNAYRLLVRVSYKSRKILILKIGTHAEYDRWVL